MTKELNNLKKQGWIKKLLNNNNIFVVGGYIRDFLLNKKSNDIDLLVCGLTHKQIENIISKHGKITETSGHFSTIKFRPFDWDSKLDDIDIVIPRKDVAMTDKEFEIAKLSNPSLNRHNAFNIVADPSMPAEMDLIRRDLTINSIAVNLMTNDFLDTFNGKKDLKNGIIKMTDERTFVDDPVRMLRTLRFANRFNFNIDNKTMLSIKKHANLITGMSKERFLIEIKKVFKAKGDLLKFHKSFVDTKFQELIFKTNKQHNVNKEINRFSEFVFLLMGVQKSSKKIFIKSLKGDVETAKEIEVLQMGIDNQTNDTINNRKLAFNMFKINNNPFNSVLFNDLLNDVIIDLKNIGFTNINDLEINGNEIKELLGINDSNIKERGMEIGKTQKLLINAILENKIKNNKKELVNFINIHIL